MGCGIIFPRDFTIAQSCNNRKPRDRRDSCDVDSLDDDAMPRESSSEDPTQSEQSAYSDDISDDSDGSLNSDDSDGIYEPVDANGANAWAMRAHDYRLLAIGRGFPVQFMQERRVRRLQKRHQNDQSGPKVQVFFTRNGMFSVYHV